MKYFESLKTTFAAFPNLPVEGLSDQELRLLLFSHSVYNSDFPASVKEYLQFCGKSLGHWGDGALGGYEDFIHFKLSMMYELAELKMPFPKKTDFVFFNHLYYSFCYVDLMSPDDDPYVSLLVTPEEEHRRLKSNFCKFSEFVINHTLKTPPEYLNL